MCVWWTHGLAGLWLVPPDARERDGGSVEMDGFQSRLDVVVPPPPPPPLAGPVGVRGWGAPGGGISSILSSLSFLWRPEKQQQQPHWRVKVAAWVGWQLGSEGGGGGRHCSERQEI